LEAQKKKVKAGEFVRDLRSGMDDEALMDKYALNRGQFHQLLRMAADSELIKTDELYSRISHSATAINRTFEEMQEAVNQLSEVTAFDEKKSG